MSGYATIDPRAFGTAYQAPEAIRRLPVQLLRVAQVTRNPGKTALAMAAYQQVAQAEQFAGAMLMPQRLMFQQHKQGPDGVSRPDTRGALTSAVSVSQALLPTRISAGTTVTAMRVPPGVPVYPQATAAAARGNTLPRVEYAPVPAALLASPRVRPTSQPTSAPPEAYGVAARAVEQSRAMERAADTAQAMASVAAIRAGVRQRIGI